jgi:hypothetical protein
MPRAGIPNIIRSDWARNLNRIYPQELGGFDLPNLLTGHVQLVHDALGTIPYAAVSIFDLLGAADVTSILTATAIPEGYIGILDEIGIQTDDTATRILTLFLHYINAVGDFAIPVFSQDSGATASRWWPVQRRVIMPPGSKLELTASALTAGKKLRMTFAYLQVPAGQFCPRS